MFKVLMIGMLFLALSAVSLFAADASVIPGAPAWLNSALAILGLAGVGGVGVFAGIAKKIAAVEAKYLPIVQGLKNAIDKDAVLFSEIKSIIAQSTIAVPSWNDAMTANAALFASIPVKGIEAKADIFNRLKITLPVATPAIVGKIEAVAAKVEQVVDKAADIAVAIPQAAATQTPIVS